MCRPNPAEDVEVPTSDEMKSPLGMKEGSAFLKEMRWDEGVSALLEENGNWASRGYNNKRLPTTDVSVASEWIPL